MSSFATSKARKSLQVILVMIALLFATTATVQASVVSKASKSECQKVTERPKWCSKVTVLGHRAVEGPASGTNENTLVALQKDHKLGVGYETDTWRLAADDGTPNQGSNVVVHDPNLHRVVDPSSYPPGVTGSTKIGQITLAQWKQLRTYGGQPLPTLHQWINHACKWGVPGIVEIKYVPGNPQEVADWTKGCGASISFYGTPHTFNGKCSYKGTQSIYAVGMKIGIKMDNRDCQPDLQTINDMGYGYVIAGNSTLTRSYVKQAHALGLKVGFFNSQSHATWTRSVNNKVDIFIAPHPGPAKKWLVGKR